jgi:hypothetical protein
VNFATAILLRSCGRREKKEGARRIGWLHPSSRDGTVGQVSAVDESEPEIADRRFCSAPRMISIQNRGRLHQVRLRFGNGIGPELYVRLSWIGLLTSSEQGRRGILVIIHATALAVTLDSSVLRHFRLDWTGINRAFQRGA